jgi:hypothetical protein
MKKSVNFNHRSILDNLPNITHVIYMEDPLQKRVKVSGFRAGANPAKALFLRCNE